MGKPFRIIFVSTTREVISRKELEQLTHWQADGSLSNFVLYDGKNLIQTLQGDQELAKALFDKIAADPRHFNANVLIEQVVDESDPLGTDLVCLQDGGSHTVDRQYLSMLLQTLNSQPASDGGTLMDVLAGFIEHH